MGKKYEVLMFDLDNTLFDFEHSEKEALLSTAKHFGLTDVFDVFEATYHEVNKPLWHALEQGSIDSDYIKTHRFSGVVERMGLDMDRLEMSRYYMSALSESVALVFGAEEVLRVLDKKYRLVALTNGLKLVQEGRIKRSGLHGHFERIIISEDVGVSKPDTRIFDMALESIGHSEKSSVLMIGDSLKADIDGAKNAGIDALWVNLKGQEPPSNKYYVGEIKKLEQLLDYL